MLKIVYAQEEMILGMVRVTRILQMVGLCNALQVPLVLRGMPLVLRDT